MRRGPPVLTRVKPEVPTSRRPRLGPGYEPIFERVEGQSPGRRTIPPTSRRPQRTTWDDFGRQSVPFPAIRLGVVVAGLILLWVGFMYFVLPSSTIVISPQATYIPVELVVRIDPDAPSIDFKNNIIPAEIVDAVASDSLSKPTTGRRRDAQMPAVGTVVLRNLTREAVIVPRGTRVRTEDGVAFVTDSEVLVPPTLQVGQRPVPGEAEVRVTAGQPGSAGNVQALAIVAVEGPLAPVLRAANPTPLSGGSEREQALVAARDHEELIVTLLERLQSSAIEQLNRERGSNRTLVVWSAESGNPQVLRKSFSADEGVPADSVRLDLELRARATSFANADMEGLLARALSDRPASADVNVDRVRITDTEIISERLGVLTMRVRGLGEAVAKIDHDAVRNAVGGRVLAEADAALRQMPGLASYHATHDPTDTANYPRLGFRIDVQITTPAPQPTG